MEIAFTLAFIFLATHRIRNVRQEGREQLAELFGITCLQASAYLNSSTICRILGFKIIIGNHCNKPLLHFIIGKIQ
mgnify:CR=1 FL=1